MITGYVLKLVRESLGLGQEALAERLGVDRNTLQEWESGRRALTSTRAASIVGLRHQLRGLGADARLLDSLNEALEADYVLGFTQAFDPHEIDARRHPLANWVIKRSFAEMLAWPFTGQAPMLFRDLATASRRGPTSSAPVLSRPERDRFFEHLQHAAERSLVSGHANGTNGALLRRQAYYLSAWNTNADTRTWLRDMERREQLRIGRLDSWSPLWVTARSLVVARARQGDKAPLRRFIARAIASDECQAASLNYWAYRIGEVVVTHHSDDFMATDLGGWNGMTLLRRLRDNLHATEPAVDIYVHSLWALLQRRARILEHDPQLAGSIGERVETFSDAQDLSEQSRRELQDLRYGVRLVQRSVSPTPVRSTGGQLDG
ncbi:MAG: helix-turn-helix domain-containing protein, partial [Actinomycetota bacterium]|nr:helix-turn-helix domain-containing protein [Actinomycetota bacterium]